MNTEGKNPNIKSICFGGNETIAVLVKKLSAHKKEETGLPGGIALVLNKKGQLSGIVTDGDIRRGLARGLSDKGKISEIMNPSPFTIRGPIESPEGVLSSLADAIRGRADTKGYVEKLVIVDKHKRPIDVVAVFNLFRTSDVRFKKIGVVGLGYVGLTLSLTLADLGFQVLGFDTDKNVMKKLLSGKTHIFEKGLSELLSAHLGKNFIPVKTFSDSARADVYIIAVGTPVSKSGVPDLSQLKSAVSLVGQALKRNDLVILRSTVPIGTTRSVVIPILEKGSGLSAGADFLVSFAPERTIEGKALSELRSLPQVVGGLNRASVELTSNIFTFLTASIVPVDSLEEAEMVKLVNNTYRDVTFGFANELYLIARAWGLDAKRIIESANYGYERSRVPLPSPGVGGYCLTKDPIIFSKSAKARGYEPKLFSVARSVSEQVVSAMSEDVFGFLKRHKISSRKARGLFLGFAFKGRPAVSDTRGATTNELIALLRKSGISHIAGFDPNVSSEAIRQAGASPVKGVSFYLKNVDVIIVMTNSEAFEKIDMVKILAPRRSPTLLFDPWGIYDRDAIAKLSQVEYKRL